MPKNAGPDVREAPAATGESGTRANAGSASASGTPAGARGVAQRRTFKAVAPASGSALEPAFDVATWADIEEATRAAEGAFPAYAATAPAERAAFLRAIAAKLEDDAGAIVTRANEESALGLPRLTGELARTANQLRMFAGIVEDGSWQDARIDRGDPNRTPAPKPDVRSMRRPIGPVAVFGASNFPLAFSVAGGDTASALAAGCPVVCKAHPAHPGTSQRVAAAVLKAADATGMPKGVFALLFDDGYGVGEALVRDPRIRAVGFTGSRSGGKALMAIASQRPVPIPVYAEMSSVNPLFVLPGAAEARGEAIADGVHSSFTLGVGQFCTNPGVVLLPLGAAGDMIRDRLAERTRATDPAVMLTAGICEAYGRGLDRLAVAGAHLVAEGPSGAGGQAHAALWEGPLAGVLADAHGSALLSEVFGPSTVLLRYQGASELIALADAMEGQLTATVHGEAAELAEQGALFAALERLAGRVIVNQFPTGVEVTDAMVHGGPYPATSDGRSTSVGGRALLRFTRLVAYQNLPQALLPEALRDR